MNEVGGTYTKSINFIEQKSSAALKSSLKSLQGMLEIFSETQKLKAFLERVWKTISDWFLKNKKMFSYATESNLQSFAKANRLKVSAQDIQTVLKLTKGDRGLAESILLSTKEIIEGRTVRQLIRRFVIKDTPLPYSLSNYRARIWYTWQKMKIEKLISKIPKLENKAKKAFELRNEYRTAARQYMSDRKLAEYLEKVEKNEEWNEFVLKLKDRKKLSGDDLWKYIIEKSKTGREGVDDLFKLNY